MWLSLDKMSNCTATTILTPKCPIDLPPHQFYLYTAVTAPIIVVPYEVTNYTDFTTGKKFRYGTL